jgi:ketosteroid isomerase-like protein
MSEKNKATLNEANAAITAGNHEHFLTFCTDDTEWTFVGDRTIKGKQALRQYLAETYAEPPQFHISDMIADGDMLTAVGDITLKNKDGKATRYSYCDVWRFRDGKLFELRAFVIEA